MILTLIWTLVLAALVGASGVASYLRLLMRRLPSVAGRKLFQQRPGYRFQADRERVGVSISALHGALMAFFAVGLTGLFFVRRPGHFWGNLGAALLVVLCVVAICDQLIPFLMVARHDEPELILEQWMPVLRAAVFAAVPLTFPILISTTLARLLEPEETKPEEPSQQEEFEDLIEVGEKEGLIEKGEGVMLQSVVDFGDKVVREVMTPRPEIAALDINQPVEALRQLFRENRHSRYAVYSGDLDHVEGIINIHDLLALPTDGQSKITLRQLVRPVAFVPETKRNTELLKELRQSTNQLAIVIDEYGSVAGLVTVEDLVEEIVGEIRDEGEPHAQDLVKESESTYLAAGATELAQVADRLHVDVEGRDYSTVAGLVLAELGHVPTPGEKVEADGLAIEVLEANERTVLKVRLKVMAPAEPATAPDGKQ
jgi:CBS domain containing-hemolysin-like protein